MGLGLDWNRMGMGFGWGWKRSLPSKPFHDSMAEAHPESQAGLWGAVTPELSPPVAPELLHKPASPTFLKEIVPQTAWGRFILLPRGAPICPKPGQQNRLGPVEFQPPKHGILGQKESAVNGKNVHK